MELYVVFEMGMGRDIMVAVFLDSVDASNFVGAQQETRYVVSIRATSDTITDWYNFREKANEAIDNPAETH